MEEKAYLINTSELKPEGEYNRREDAQAAGNMAHFNHVIVTNSAQLGAKLNTAQMELLYRNTTGAESITFDNHHTGAEWTFKAIVAQYDPSTPETATDPAEFSPEWEDETTSEAPTPEAPAFETVPFSKARNKIGVKDQLRQLFTENCGTFYDIEELKGVTGGTTSSIRTALSDLRSDKYAGQQGTLAIVKKDKKYGLESTDAVGN